jgi:hypothetical protein
LRATPNLATALADANGAEITAPRQERLDLWPLVALLALAAISAEWAAILWSGVRGTVRQRMRSGAT